MKKTTKRKKVSRKKLQKGASSNIFVLGILLAITLAAFAIVGGGVPSSVSPTTGTEVNIASPAPDASHKSLQLETFGFTTIMPTQVPTGAVVTLPAGNSTVPSVPATATVPPAPPGNFPTAPANAAICSDDDDGVIVPPTCRCLAFTVECVNGVAQNISTGGYYPKLPVDNLVHCGTPPYAANGRYCVGKPVIYLYPKVPTHVNVQVITSGDIVVSDPTYPQGGWKDILAYPNGTFQYHNKKYSELFYESSVTTFQKPEQGIVIPTSQLSDNLNGALDQLGLIGGEKKEFIDYWVPRLEALHSSYIFFSVLSPGAKDVIDHVVITPKPDTEIAFIAYFKPINTPAYGSVLQFPPTPKRIGFTSVEWGGVVDNN